MPGRRNCRAAEQTVLAAAGEAGAVVVFPESLYSYSEPRATHERGGSADCGGRQAGCPDQAPGGAGRLPGQHCQRGFRRFLWPTGADLTWRRACGPHSAGRQEIVGHGSTDQPHSFTYVPDLAAAMIHAAETPSLWNTAWHAPTGPAVTQRQLATAVHRGRRSTGAEDGAIPGWALRAMGVFSKDSAKLPRCSTSSSSRL